MKKVISLLSILLALVVLLCACAQEPTPTTVPTTEPTTVPTTEPTTVPTTEPTTVPTTEPTTVPTTEPTTEPTSEPTTEPTVPVTPWIQGRDSFDDVVVHPYTPDELQDAMDVAMSILDGYKEKEYVLDFQVHWIAFDPVGTDNYLQMYEPKPTWEGDDHYPLWIRFVIEFTVHYDHTLSPNEDRENHLGYIMLTRDTADGVWVLDQGMCSDSVSGTLASTVVMPLAEVDALGLTDTPVLAAYRLVVDLEKTPYLEGQRLSPENVYILYVLDEENQSVRCEMYPIPKATEPVTEELTDIQYFQQLLKYTDGAGKDGYNAALNCTFEKPEDLNLGLFFWSHFDTGERWEDLSDEEKEFLESRGITSWFDIEKHSAKTMDAVLQEYFGLPISAFQSPQMLYYEQTDCYYKNTSSPLIQYKFAVTEVEYGEGGIVKVYYLFDPQDEFTGKYVLTLQEKPGDGETGYYILSHLRIE